MRKHFIFLFILVVVGLGLGQDSGSQKDKLAVGEHWADVGGIHFWYRVAGKGPLLIVQSPGWGASSDYLRNGLALLEKNFTVIYYDTRGSGHSSRPSDEKRMGTDDMVADLGALREYWGLNSIAVLGHSHGGAIALGYAIHHPDMVSKLILVDTCTEDHDFNAERQLEITARKNDPRFKDAIAAMMSSGDPKTDEEFDGFLKKILPIYFYDPATGVPRFAKTDTALPSIWAHHAFEAPRPVTKQESLLDQVKAKTLVLVGHDDWICPVSEGERLHSGISGSRLVVLEKSGHFPWIEAPEEFFGEVARFGK